MKRSFVEACLEVASSTYVVSNDYAGDGWPADEYGPFDLDLSAEPEPKSILYAESMEMEAIQRGGSFGVSDKLNSLLVELRGFKNVFCFPYRIVSETRSSGV